MKIILDEGAKMPTRAHADDAGLDLYSRENRVIYPRSSATFDTGVHVEIPRGYVGMKLASTVDALCDMVNQFAFESSPYRGKTTLYHGGLSALESAFAALEAMGARFTADGRLPRKELFRIWHETGKEDRK